MHQHRFRVISLHLKPGYLHLRIHYNLPARPQSPPNQLSSSETSDAPIRTVKFEQVAVDYESLSRVAKSICGRDEWVTR